MWIALLLHGCRKYAASRMRGRARRGERGPCADDAFDRLERAAQQHRGCDDRTRLRSLPSIASTGTERQARQTARTGARTGSSRSARLPANCAWTVLASAIRRCPSCRSTIAPVIPSAFDRGAVCRRGLLTNCEPLPWPPSRPPSSSGWHAGLTQATVTRSRDAKIARMPIQKWSMNATSRNTGRPRQHRKWPRSPA